MRDSYLSKEVVTNFIQIDKSFPCYFVSILFTIDQELPTLSISNFGEEELENFIQEGTQGGEILDDENYGSGHNNTKVIFYAFYSFIMSKKLIV